MELIYLTRGGKGDHKGKNNHLKKKEEVIAAQR